MLYHTYSLYTKHDGVYYHSRFIQKSEWMTLCCRRRIFLYIKNYLSSSEDVMTKRSHLNVLSFIMMLIQVDIIKLLEPTVIFCEYISIMERTIVVCMYTWSMERWSSSNTKWYD